MVDGDGRVRVVQAAHGDVHLVGAFCVAEGELAAAGRAEAAPGLLRGVIVARFAPGEGAARYEGMEYNLLELHDISVDRPWRYGGFSTISLISARRRQHERAIKRTHFAALFGPAWQRRNGGKGLIAVPCRR